ncbi:MAG: substrate-binding domain-containing protein [Pirellulales bacterium]|nr:substrate-binding domain-containing protein [Pirellulales bacterium]
MIGVSVLATTNPFFVELADAMVAEGAKHNFKVMVTSGENTVATQMTQIREFIAQQVDAIALCPCDSRAIGTSIAAANEAGIPVFTADIASLAEGAEVVCHVASDNYGGGKLAGQTMVELLGATGKVAIIDFPEIESVILRTKGFRDVVGLVEGVEIVGAWPGGGDQGSVKP